MSRSPAAVQIWLALLVLAPVAQGHTPPKQNHDRSFAVRVTPEALVIEATLEVDEGWAVQELPAERLAGLTSRRAYHEAYARFMGPALAAALSARLDGRPLTLTCEVARAESLDHIRCEFVYRAPWTLEPGSRHTITFEDGTYPLDDFSLLRVGLTASWRLTLEKLEAPPEGLAERLPEQRGAGEYAKLRRAGASFAVTPSVEPGQVRGGLPPAPDPIPPPPRRKLLGALATSKDAPARAVAHALPPPGVEEAPSEAATTQGPRDLRDLLFDTSQGFGVLLLLAGAFGAAHALTPGHGKTLVAAYLVGQHGTVGHAVVLGVATTLSHTWAVLAVAGFLTLVPQAQEAARVLLGLVGGLIVAGLGFWLLLRRLAGQADHVHLFEGHGHGHGEGHSHSHSHGGQPGAEGSRAPGWWGVILLGLAGGIVPCLDAVLLLLFAIGAQRLWLALPLLLAFSAGLASVLVLLGVVVVKARDLAVSRWGASQQLERVGQVFPLVSAAVIAVMGLWLCFSSLSGGH